MNVNELTPAQNDAVMGGSGLPATQRRVVAMTLDPTLSRALEELAALHVTVVQVASIEALAEQVLQGESAIALLDAAATDRPIDILVDRLTTQFPDLRMIVAGHSLEQGVLATRIAQGTVFRFLHKPASAQRLKLFVDAASRPTEAAKTHAAAANDAQREFTPRSSSAAAGPQGPRRGPGGLPLPAIIAATAAIVAMAAGFVLFTGKDEPASSSATTAAPAGVPANAASGTPSADVEALIRSADQAFAAQRFAAKDGSSAGELYQRALLAAPQDARARSGLSRSIDFALRNAEIAFTEARYADAEVAISALQVIAPGNSRLAFLSTQLQRERERTTADENRRLSAEARQEKLRTTLQQANDRLRRGVLTERDSALELLFTAQDLAPADADVRAFRERLGTRLIETATQRLDAGDLFAARSLLDAAGTLGTDNTAVTRLRRRADELTAAGPARTANDTSPAAAPTPASAVPTPTPPAASTTAPAATTPPPAAPVATPAAPVVRLYTPSELTLVRKVEVEYPERALKSGIAGWADVEFTIEADGSVKNVIVLNSEPRGMFEANTQQALRRWRYKPVMENGKAIEVRSRMRIRFTPADE